MPRPLLYIGISLIVVLVQTTLVPYIAVGGIVPDLALIWIVYLGISRGHVAASTAGFLIGLLLDILSAGDTMLGLSSLTKSLTGFLAGYTFNENKTTQIVSGPQFPAILTALSLVHNLVYFVIFLQGSDLSWNDTIVLHGIPSTVYTVLASVIPVFVFARRYRT